MAISQGITFDDNNIEPMKAISLLGIVDYWLRLEWQMSGRTKITYVTKIPRDKLWSGHRISSRLLDSCRSAP